MQHHRSQWQMYPVSFTVTDVNIVHSDRCVQCNTIIHSDNCVQYCSQWQMWILQHHRSQWQMCTAQHRHSVTNAHSIVHSNRCVQCSAIFTAINVFSATPLFTVTDEGEAMYKGEQLEFMHWLTYYCYWPLKYIGQAPNKTCTLKMKFT